MDEPFKFLNTIILLNIGNNFVIDHILESTKLLMLDSTIKLTTKFFSIYRIFVFTVKVLGITSVFEEIHKNCI